MRDRKVVMYGLVSDGGDPEVITMQAISVNGGSAPGFVNTNFHFSDGTNLFSLNPFNAEFNVDAEIFDMVPVVSFMYLAGPDTGTDTTTIFGRAKFCFSQSISNPTASMMVAEVAGEPAHDAPAVNTAATVTLGTGADEASRLNGFGFTITAVAAIVAPVLVELRSDPGGANTLMWSGRYLVPAGTTKDVWIPGPMVAPNGAQLTVAAPGATNFVTATIVATGTGIPPS